MTETIRTQQVEAAGAPFALTHRPAPQPGPGHARVAVEASGICHTDHAIVTGAFGDVFPLVPGHEIAGRIDALGAGVTDWRLGDRVVIGWFGGNCGDCRSCRLGDAFGCVSLQTPGLSYPGGFADALVVPVSALARVPDALSSVDASVMGCAGVTVFNALRHSGARPGDVVGVLGLGGLGHLGVQFAAKMGFTTVAIARGAAKRELAIRLGADHAIDSTTDDVVAALQRLGGARVILATAVNADVMTAAIDGLSRHGELIVIGAVPEPIMVTPYQLVLSVKKIYGAAAGTALDVEETMQFAARTGVRPIVEEASLEDIALAFHRMVSGEARFRIVLRP